MIKYDVQVNAKVKRETAKLLKDTGHPARDALEFFVRDFFSKKPWKIIQVNNFFLEKELTEIDEEIDRLEYDRIKIIDKIRSNNLELDNYSEKINKDKIIESKYSDSCLVAVESIQEMYDKRAFLSEDSVFEVIDSSVFEIKARNCDMEVDEFKEAVSELIH